MHSRQHAPACWRQGFPASLTPRAHIRPDAPNTGACLKVENVIEMPQNDKLSLLEASRICNTDIVGRVQQARPASSARSPSSHVLGQLTGSTSSQRRSF